MNQDPGTNQEIKEFCEINYGVTFQMMDKSSVKGKISIRFSNGFPIKAETAGMTKLRAGILQSTLLMNKGV
jgi:glutathione peroxidase-family protein